MSPRRTAEDALATRDAILDAAFRVARGGAGRFTIDAVAAEAGVSKGAVLHHFPGKRALATGLVMREVEVFERAIARRLAGEPGAAPGRWLRAYIGASFELGATYSVVSEVVLTVAERNPELDLPLEAAFAEWRRRAAADGIDPARAAIIRYAVDGIALADLFAPDAPAGAEREALLTALLGMTRD